MKTRLGQVLLHHKILVTLPGPANADASLPDLESHGHRKLCARRCITNRIAQHPRPVAPLPRRRDDFQRARGDKLRLRIALPRVECENEISVSRRHAEP